MGTGIVTVDEWVIWAVLLQVNLPVIWIWVRVLCEMCGQTKKLMSNLLSLFVLAMAWPLPFSLLPEG